METELQAEDENSALTFVKREYWCFISYRHADNKEPGRQWATWLHQSLEAYEVPADLVGKTNERGDKIPQYLYPIFRDEEELPADAELSRPIEAALQRSRFMIVVCSQRAVQSRFVADEILRFKQLGKEDRIMAAIVDGEPNVTGGKTGFPEDLECFPEPLRFKLREDGRLSQEPTEPIAPDFRLSDGSPGWTSPAAYRESLEDAGVPRSQIAMQVEEFTKRQQLMFLKLVAGILGLPLGVLTDRHEAFLLEKQKARTKALVRSLIVVGVLAVGAFASMVIAINNQAEAERQKAAAKIQESEAKLQRDKARQGEGRYWLELAKQSINSDSVPTFPEIGLLAGRAIGFRNETGIERLNGTTLEELTIPLLTRETNAQEYLSATQYINVRLNPVFPVWTSPVRKHHDYSIRDLGLLGKGLTEAISIDVTGGIKVWDHASGRLLRSGEAKATVRSAAAGGDTIALGRTDGSILLLFADSLDVNRRTVAPLSGEIHEVSMDRNEHLVCGTSSEGQACVWDIRTSQPVLRLPADGRPLSSTAINPEGTHVCHANRDSVGITPLSSGATVTLPLPAGTGIIRHLQWSKDGRWVCGCDESGRVFIWETSGQATLKVTLDAGGAVARCVFDEASKVLATIPLAGADPATIFWSIPDGTKLAEAPPPPSLGKTLDLVFLPGTSSAILATDDGALTKWDYSKGNPLEDDSAGQCGAIRSVAFSDDGKLLATASSDGSIDVQDFSQHPISVRKIPGRHGTSVIHKLCYPFDDGRTLLALDTAGDLISVDPKGKATYIALAKPNPKCLTAHRGTKQIAIGYRDGSVELRSLADLDKVVLKADIPSNSDEMFKRLGIEMWPISLAFDPLGRKLAVGLESSGIGTWEKLLLVSCADLSVEGVFYGDEHRVNDVSFQENSSLLISAGQEGRMSSWNTAAPKEDPNFTDAGAAATAVAFSHGWRKLALGTEKGRVKIFDRDLSIPVAEINSSSQAITSIAFAPDGNSIAVGAEDGTCRIWNVSRMKEKSQEWTQQLVGFLPSGEEYISYSDVSLGAITVGSLELHRHLGSERLAFELLELFRQRAAALSSDGSLVALCGTRERADNLQPKQDEWNGECILWDTARRQLVRRWLPHIRTVSAVAISGGERRIATGSYDGIKVWRDGPEGDPLWTWSGDHSGRKLQRPQPDQVEALAFSPNDKILACSLQSGALLLLDAETGAILSRHSVGTIATCLRFSQDGETLFAGLTGDDIAVVQLSEGRFTGFKYYLRQAGHICSLDLHPGGKLLATLSQKGDLCLWDLDRRGPDPTFSTSANRFGTSVRFHPDGKSVLTSGSSNITAWSLSPPDYSRYLDWGRSSRSLAGAIFDDRTIRWTSTSPKIGETIHFPFVNLDGQSHLALLRQEVGTPGNDLFWHYLGLGNWTAARSCADLTNDAHLAALIESPAFGRLPIDNFQISIAMDLPKPRQPGKYYEQARKVLDAKAKEAPKQ